MGIMTSMRNRMHVVLWALLAMFLLSMTVGGLVGGANIKGMFPNETLSIFVMPPSIEILRERLIERGDVSKEEIDVRIKKAESELDYASKFDNIIINNDLEESKKIAHTLIKEFIDE